MPNRTNAYISFRDNAREAMEFYRSVFGGELMLQTFSEFGVSEDPSEADKVMHAQLESDGVLIMGADTPNSMPYEFGTNISMALFGDDKAQLSGWFDHLSEGGTVDEPLVEAPWGDTFGQLTDRFGIRWMVNIAGNQAQGQGTT
jgi:PhnB protein